MTTFKKRMTTFTCHSCKTKKTVDSTFTSGYGLNSQGKKLCYVCCAKVELEYMRDHDKNILYFTGDHVTDWTGELKFELLNVKKGKHNMAGIRYDYWFIFDGFIWHGYTIGNNTQIAHCKKTKETA